MSSYNGEGGNFGGGLSLFFLKQRHLCGKGSILLWWVLVYFNMRIFLRRWSQRKTEVKNLDVYREG